MKKIVFASVAAAFVLALGFISIARAEDSKATADIGKPAPDFSLQDQSGKTVNLADYKGKIVVLEWFNNDCPYVQRHYKAKTMDDLASKYSSKDVVWLAINSTSGKSNDDNKAIASEWSINHP